MPLFKKISKEEKLVNKERKRIHDEVIKKEYQHSKEDKVCPEGAFVSLRNVNKIYDNHVQAVYNFNLDIKPQEFIVFVGPSGCGKSTTLRMIAGLEDITYGDLFINSMYANDLQPKDRDIAMVFQSYALYPHMTVYDNIAFGLKMRKVPTLRNDKKKYNDQLKIVKEKEKVLGTVKDELGLNSKKLLKEDNEILKEKVHELQTKYDELKADLDKESEILQTIKNTPIPGIDYATIRKIKKDKRYYERSLNELKKEEAKLNENLNSKPLEVETTKNLLAQNLKNQVLANESVERTNKALDYYENNLVPIYDNKHLSKRDVKLQVERAAKILDLTDYLDRKPNALSGGQCQRVALGRAIVRNSKLFLMDEPLSNLDAKLRVQMRSEIVKLHNELKTTTIYVTHDQTEAMTMASRIVVMSKGYIQQIGEPKEIYNHPANIFVATFIGSPAMNIMDVNYNNGTLKIAKDYELKLSDEFIKAHDDFYKNELDSITEEIESITQEVKAYETYQENLKNKQVKPSKNELLNDTNHYQYNTILLKRLNKKKEQYEEIIKTKTHVLKMGIRPEDIVRLEDKTSKHHLSKSFVTEVSVSELLGHEYYVHFNMDDKELIAKTQGNDNIKIGDKIEFGFNLEFLHLFDEISTKLIK